MSERVVIASGFGAFRGYVRDDENPSNLLAKRFAAEVAARGMRCAVVAPVTVNWGEVERVMATMLEAHRGARITWVAFGAGRGFAIETHATNRRTASQPDASGRWAGKDVSILNDTAADPDATSALALSADALVAMQMALEASGFPVSLSSDAGGYICNSAAYALYSSQQAGRIELGIFLHTPEAVPAEQRDAFAGALADVLLSPRRTARERLA